MRVSCRFHMGYGCLLVALWASQAAGREIFVNNVTGDDRATGERVQRGPDATVGPMRTIAKALQAAHGGDTISLVKTNVPYRESISLVGSRHGGSPEQPFTIRGNGATLDGSAPVAAKAWEHYRGPVFRFRPIRTAYQQVFLDGRPAMRAVVSQSAVEPPELKPRQWCLCGGYIYFRVEKGKLPGDYPLTCAREQTGITLFHVEGVVIADLIVRGFQLDGIHLCNTARRVTLVGVTCCDNGRSGVVVGGASAADIVASSLGDNGEAQLLTLPYSETHLLRNTRLSSNTAPAWVDRGGRVYRDAKLLEGGRDDFRPAGPREPKS